jgi:hypothetical protein
MNVMGRELSKPAFRIATASDCVERYRKIMSFSFSLSRPHRALTCFPSLVSKDVIRFDFAQGT